MATTGRRGTREEGPPTSFPEGPPSSMPMDHSWTLQSVMQMQKDLGVLGEKIDRMREDFSELKTENKETREKVHGVDKSISKAKGAVVVIGAIYTGIIGIFCIFLAWFLRLPAGPPPASPPVMQQSLEEKAVPVEAARSRGTEEGK